MQGEGLLSSQREGIFFPGSRERVAQRAELWDMLLLPGIPPGTRERYLTGVTAM